MGLFDNLTGMLGGGPSEGQQGEAGGLGMFSQLLGQGGGGPSSNFLGSLLGGGQQAQGTAPQESGQAPAAGGIAGMLEPLAYNGLGDHVSSWLSNNPNLPINPQQIHDALGSQQVEQMAASSGLPVGNFLQQLAQHLPQAASEQAGVSPG